MSEKAAVSEKKTTKKTKTLVIVESPAKAKTIEHYLGTGYTVKASMGHLIDLPKSRMAINVEDNFQPEYITVHGRAKLLKELQKDAKNSDNVFLASDNDREGEAIAWHLNNVLKDKTKAKIGRIVFNEITPVAIKEAVKHPGDIDESKVNAQKARRVLDRLVGYNLSPLLWKKVKNGLSAGRVQSVALRLICQREEEVENFILHKENDSFRGSPASSSMSKANMLSNFSSSFSFKYDFLLYFSKISKASFKTIL